MSGNDGDVSAAAPRAGRRLRRAAVTAAAAGAAVGVAALLAWALQDPPSPADATAPPAQPGGVVLVVYVTRSTGAVERLVGEARIQAGETMRLEVVSVHAGYAAVVDLDGTPSVTLLVPRAGTDRLARIEARGALLLDGSLAAGPRPGFRRLVAVVCEKEKPLEDLRRRAEEALRAAGGSPEAVSSLDTGCSETSALLENRGARP